MKKESWTRKESAELSDMPVRSIQFYSEQPGLLPDLERYVGRGKARKYSYDDLLALLVIRELIFYGMTVGKISQVLGMWRILYEDWWDQEVKDEGYLIVYRLVGDREGMSIEFRRDTKMNWKGVRSALVLDVGRLIKELKTEG